MVRFLLISIFLLLALRVLVAVARLIAWTKRRPPIDPGRSPEPTRPSPYDTSNAIDVPFTEIPPETPR